MKGEAELSLESQIRKCLSSVLSGFILLHTKHTLVLHGCLQAVPAHRRLVGGKKRL